MTLSFPDLVAAHTSATTMAEVTSTLSPFSPNAVHNLSFSTSPSLIILILNLSHTVSSPCTAQQHGRHRRFVNSFRTPNKFLDIILNSNSTQHQSQFCSHIFLKLDAAHFPSLLLSSPLFSRLDISHPSLMSSRATLPQDS